MMSTVKINGKTLKQLREKYALSQEGLEYACSQRKNCSVSIATIKRAELGADLNIRTATRLAHFFDIPIGKLIILDTQQTMRKPNFNIIKTEGIVLWLRATSKILLSDIMKHTDVFAPFFSQCIGNTLVICFPYQLNDKKIYLSLQNLLLHLSLTSEHQFHALIMIDTLQLSPNKQWTLNEQQMHLLTDIAQQIHPQSIIVCTMLYQASRQYFLYQNNALISGFHTLIKQHRTAAVETVGRDNEIQLFQYAIDIVQQEQTSCFVTISGSEGMGKSHMLDVLTSMVTKQHWQVIRLDFELSTTPVELFLEQLAHEINNSNTHFIQQDASIDSILLELISYFDTHTTPNILLFDNFHLVNQPSIQYFFQLIEKLQLKRTLFAVSYLPSSNINSHIENLSDLGLPIINAALAPLPIAQLKLLPSDNVTISPSIKQSYLEIANGNPHHFRQLLLKDESDDNIPETMRLYLQSKINSLSSLSRMALALISFSSHNLTLNDITVMTSLPEAIIEEQKNMRLIKISHNKIVTAFYPFLKKIIKEDISHEDRCYTYTLLANQLKQNTSKTALNMQLRLGDYYSQGEAWVNAAETFLLCGQHYLGKGEYSQAQWYLNLALEHHQKAPDALKHNELLLDIHLGWATFTRITHGWVSHSTVAAYQNCIFLAKNYHCTKRHCISLSGLWVTQLMAMEFEQSEETANEILLLAEKSNDPSCKSLAHSCLANTQYWLAKHPLAIHNAKKSFQYFQITEDKASYNTIGFNPIVLAACFGSLSATILCLDDDIQYFQHHNKDEAIINDPFSYAITLQGEIWVNYHHRNFDEVISLSTQLLFLADSYSIPFYKGFAMMFKGWAQFFVSIVEEETSLKLIEEGYNNWLASSGDQIAHSLYSLVKSEIYIKIAQKEKAIPILEKGIKLAMDKKELCYLAPMLIILAELKPEYSHYKEMAKTVADEQKARLFQKSLDLV